MEKQKTWKEMEKELLEKPYYFRMKQECLYYNSTFLRCKWYRKLYGGQWRLLKLGKDTPYMMMFTVWTKITVTEDGSDCWDGYYEVIETETYPETGVVTMWQLFKEFFKQLVKKK